MDVITRLASWLYCRSRDYHEGLTLLQELKIDPEDTAFFEVSAPDRIHHSLLWRKLSDYARIHNIRPIANGVTKVPANHQLQNKEVAGPNHFPQQNYLLASAASNFSPPPLPFSPSSGERRLVSGAEPSRTTPLPSQKPHIDKNPTVRYEDLPANLQVLFDENGRLAREMKSLHAELKLLKDLPDGKEKRAELARELVSRQKQSRANWNAIDTWWATHKSEEDAVAVAAREALAKDRRIKANLNYIRRYYGKDKFMPEVKRRMDELDKWEVSYEKLIG